MRWPGTLAGVIAIALAWVGANAWMQPTLYPRDPVVPKSTSKGARIHYPEQGAPSLRLPDGGQRIVRSVLGAIAPLRFGDYLWDDTGVPSGETWIRVDLAHQTLSVFRAGHEIGTAVILFGTDGKATPSGIFPVLAKAKDHQSTLYDAPMPYMLRLTGDGVAIHASNVRAGSATHGCIGVPPEFARRLYGEVQRGDQVVILPIAPSAVPPAA